MEWLKISKVDFKSLFCINIQAYKHIDFATEYGLPFIVIDEDNLPKSGDMVLTMYQN